MIYRRMHIPTGNVSEFFFTEEEHGLAVESELTRLRLIDKWNREGREIWKYWTV